MITGIINQQVDEHFTVTDSHGNLISGIDSTDFIVYIYNPLGMEVSSSIGWIFTELGNGNYKYSFIPNLNGMWYVCIIHPIYFPWSKTDDAYISSTDLTEVYDIVRKTLGLVHHNMFIDETSFDENGNMVSARVRIYSDSSSVGTDNNVIEKYLITADGTECGRFNYWQQVVIP